MIELRRSSKRTLKVYILRSKHRNILFNFLHLTASVFAQIFGIQTPYIIIFIKSSIKLNRILLKSTRFIFYCARALLSELLGRSVVLSSVTGPCNQGIGLHTHCYICLLGTDLSWHPSEPQFHKSLVSHSGDQANDLIIPLPPLEVRRERPYQKSCTFDVSKKTRNAPNLTMANLPLYGIIYITFTCVLKSV